MLPVTLDTLRVALHVLAATIWVGGQFTLAALVPVVRRAAPGTLAAVARRFATLAWSAYAVLVATGVWNLLVLSDGMQGSYRRTVEAKVAIVAASGVAAAIHQRARSRVLLGVFGALSGLTALLALVLGVMLGG